MSADKGRAIFDFMVKEIMALRDGSDPHEEVAVRIGGFALPVAVIVKTMEYHVDGMMKIGGTGEDGRPREIFLSPSQAMLDFYLHTAPEPEKEVDIGFRVIGDPDEE